MIAEGKGRCVLWTILFLFLLSGAGAQICDTNYYSIYFKNTGLFNLSRSLTLSDNTTLSLENNNYYPPGLINFTAQGNVVWSYNYNAPFGANGNHPWTDLTFNAVASTQGSAVYVGGSVTKHGVFSDNTETPPPRTVATLHKIDRYGKVVWSRYYAATTTIPLLVSDITVTNDGNAVCYLSNGADSSYGKLICVTPEGNIKWMTLLNTGIFRSGQIMQGGRRSIRQISNGTIVIGDVVTNFSSSAPTVIHGEYHFIGLNPGTGALAWESSYEFPTDPTFYVPDINNITELPNGNLSFQTSLNVSTPGNVLAAKKAINIITGDTGLLQKAIVYYPQNGTCNTVDALTDLTAGYQSVLLSENEKAILIQLDPDGNIIRSKKYGSVASNLPPTCFNLNSEGYNIFLANFTNEARLLRTDQVGNLDCDTTATIMIAEPFDLTRYGNVNNVHTKTSLLNDNLEITTGMFVVAGTSASPLQKETDCQKSTACCVDVIDTINTREVQICEGGNYLLPDNSKITDSGTYFVTYKTPHGCDSVIYFHAKVIKNPASLSLGLDTCLAGAISMTLHATGGFSSYSWMGNSSDDNLSSFVISKPGDYWVSVSNFCGYKADTIHVFDNCDFPIYMPTAFTPNNDGRNDVYRVPPGNNNRMIRLTIFNRWGQMLFSTTDKSKGWDGTKKGEPQATDVYVYYLEMQGITGRKFSQKGTFALIR
jgi:gliding motility-associated-like protein